MGISTEFSKLDDKTITRILDKFGIDEIGAYVRLWPETIQIDGDLSLKELQGLVEIMKVHLDAEQGLDK